MPYHNRYYIMRHGQSEANVAGKIVSHPDIGCQQYGLSDQGRQQIIGSLKSYRGPTFQQVYCSDFQRTKETALLVTQLLSLPSPVCEPLLRERFFGHLDGCSDDHYEHVWQQDAAHPNELDNGVETTEQVFRRAITAIERLEELHKNQTILLVSHGDVLQILRTAWFDLASHEHRQLPVINTAEIILLNAS
ncbi:histidine phosphatase family protein [Marinomonas fungiae]|uniref:Broad specificity phosphatase PhoE n=1 Tax=Marinomonas fungiae TaxID=1137284 RepID=A0A0K6II04_9GAMM|nr:histidine phosphatase family protein [Marinomonas fungiae]CUB02734.1 Broad specificity phosphatase PhoE [Marinomonas fungiae]